MTETLKLCDRLTEAHERIQVGYDCDMSVFRDAVAALKERDAVIAEAVDLLRSFYGAICPVARSNFYDDINVIENNARAFVEKHGGGERGYVWKEPDARDDVVAYMLRAPGCVTGPTESLFENAIHRALKMPAGTAIVELVEKHGGGQ